MRIIFVEGRQSKYVHRTNKSGEFVNWVFKIVERKGNPIQGLPKWNQGKLCRMRHQNDRTKTAWYVDVIQDVVKSYNNTIHRSLGDAPNSVDEKKRVRIPAPSIPHKETDTFRQFKFEFVMGKTVRISHVWGFFDQEYSKKMDGVNGKCLKSKRGTAEKAFSCTH